MGGRGNDSFDYEEKFPKDKQYGELGPATRVWRAYLEECAAFGIEMIEGWRDGLEFCSFSLVFSLRWSLRSSHLMPVPKMPLIRTLREAEREAVKRSADETDARALSWLFSVSSNPSVQRIVAESTGALPIRSVTSVQRYAEGLPRVCTFTLKELLDDAHRNDVLVDTSKMDRCIRTHLRFQFRDVYIRKYDEGDQLAPDLRAELLVAETYAGSQNALGLIVATLRTPPDSQSLHLQPVVCGCLLSKILTLNREVYEHPFHALPTFYWSADCKLPPHFYQLKDCDTHR
ncbi:hypothetical protein ARMSODRAFT_167505 [Armillaria solidipes]|uniref:Uncharacterized protein n=1 Tax=Armillaria solidipes TaxID=1076256 RepID=A0A2H3BRD0_9AGAR|nr:hypothetical protein ARMSODRAFT_167505 [Armillaria solidipes]